MVGTLGLSPLVEDSSTYEAVVVHNRRVVIGYAVGVGYLLRKLEEVARLFILNVSGNNVHERVSIWSLYLVPNTCRNNRGLQNSTLD